jgi:hypothetical protein
LLSRFAGAYREIRSSNRPLADAESHSNSATLIDFKSGERDQNARKISKFRRVDLDQRMYIFQLRGTPSKDVPGCIKTFKTSVKNVRAALYLQTTTGDETFANIGVEVARNTELSVSEQRKIALDATDMMLKMGSRPIVSPLPPVVIDCSMSGAETPTKANVSIIGDRLATNSPRNGLGTTLGLAYFSIAARKLVADRNFSTTNQKLSNELSARHAEDLQQIMRMRFFDPVSSANNASNQNPSRA